MSDPKLTFSTLAHRRELAWDRYELAPVAASQMLAYGSQDRTVVELQLALSELADEAHPRTVARHLLPQGVRIEIVEVEVGRKHLPGRLGRPHKIHVTIIAVPEPRTDRAHPEADAIPPAGHWVFIPVLDHAIFVHRSEDLAERITSALEVLPTALGLDADGWRRLLTWVPSTLEPIEVELATTPLSEAKGRKALAEEERRRLAIATLDGAGRRMAAADPPPPLVGRGDALAELTRILGGKARRSVLLVGDEAVGKSALVIAWRAATQRSADAGVWATSVSELIAGASGLGEWQQRVASVLAAAETLDAVLYFDDFGALFADRPAEGGIEIGAAMRRHVVDGRVRVIGELTGVALDRAERRDVSLIGGMLRVNLAPTDPATTTAACLAWAQHWQKTQPHRPQIAQVAVPTAVELARRYLPYRAFPGKAVRLLEELRVAHDSARDASGKGPTLGESELFAAFSWSTGIPIALLADDRALPPAEVVAALRRRMVGQGQAVRRVADAICVAKARLQPPDKPLASLLFVGPSGVGKTELARSVAAYLFNAPDRMVRLDMSEYTDPWAAGRLFGDDAGTEGRLTAAVRSQPFGVVLLDEIEKAHPSVFDLLLQVLGEARLTDGRGRTTHFHNAIIILTSNLGTRSARGRLGLAPSEDADEREERRYRDAVLAAFRPELINRLDQIVVFHPLDHAEIARVAEIAIQRLAERRGFTQSGAILDVSQRALELLAETGFSAELGARALRRHLDDAVLAPAARLLAKAGSEGHGGTLTVRAPDELEPKRSTGGATIRPPSDPDEGVPEDASTNRRARPVGARIGEVTGDVTVTLWRRAAATGKRLVRSALALGELRRATDRELALPAATAVSERIGEVEATLATARDKAGDKRARLPGPEIARLSTEHARLLAAWTACRGAQAELHTAEELCLDALARDIDAVDLIDGAIAQRRLFRRNLFDLVVALRQPAPGATLLVHTPDARSAVNAWVTAMMRAAAHEGFTAHVHLWNEHAPGWKLPWGPPHDLAWVRENFALWNPPAALLRIAGSGADLLFALEAGLHRFHGLAGEGCHVWVDALEPKADFTEAEWNALPQPPAPKVARGAAMREVQVDGEVIQVGRETVDVPWSELPERLPEVAVARILATLADPEGDEDSLWVWDHPLQALDATAEGDP